MQERYVQATPLPAIECLKDAIQEKIWHPVIISFYKEFIRNGTYTTLEEILTHIPSESHPPILHTLTTHVTMEKPIFIYGIGVNLAPEDRVRFVAASTHLLWCLSLIVDDILDGDTQRANQATAWAIYGKREAYSAALASYEVLQRLTEERFSLQVRATLVEYVKGSLESLDDPSIRNLDTTIEDILRNIDHRARFHCEYPILALSPSPSEATEETKRAAIEGLFCVNRAGQILNDVKDLVPSGLYGREVFSDLRSGIATVPLLMLYQASSPEEKNLLTICFGNPSLIDENNQNIREIVTRRLPKSPLYSLIEKNYSTFLSLMEEIISPNYFSFCQTWVDYKLEQANQLLQLKR